MISSYTIRIRTQLNSTDVLVVHEVHGYCKSLHYNGMIANVGKHQATVLGNTDYEFSFPVKDKIELFGLTIDNELNFKRHITILCEKMNNQFNVIRRFRKLISTSTMLRLYKAFILPHFYYCSIVWHFCGKRNTDKMEALNKRILRFILKDNDSNYSQLLEKAGTQSYIINVSRICSLYFLNLFTLTIILST